MERDSLSFEEIRKLAEGGLVTKESKPRFHRNMKELSLSINPLTLNIRRSLTKTKRAQQDNNQYLPPVVNLIDPLNNPCVKSPPTVPNFGA